jgi:hypothetical protein
MKKMLQSDQVDAVSKMSEYALLNPNFDEHFVKIELNNSLKQLRV